MTKKELLAASRIVCAGAIAAWLFLLQGCASDPADRAFFNRGWVLPEKAANERMLPQQY